MNPAKVLMGVLANPHEAPWSAPRCYECKHRREVPGNAHIACAKPCDRVTGSPHGIRNGWFMYPLVFDPTWMTTPCTTFESAETVSPAVSDPVSRETV